MQGVTDYLKYCLYCDYRYGSVHPEFFPGSLADAGLGATAAADNGNVSTYQGLQNFWGHIILCLQTVL